MAKLTTIEGIGEILADKLKGAGVMSVEKLLERGATPKGRKDLVALSGLDAKRILRFVNHADLMRIRGIGGQYAELLEAAGVDTVVELAQRNARNLHTRMKEVNAEKKLVRQVASASQIEEWVKTAQGLPRRVSY